MSEGAIDQGISLHSQVVRSMLLVFSVALAGLFCGQWLYSRAYVQKQLASHAQDAASSLALVLASALKDNDIVLARTMVLPVVDRGYYRSVALVDNAGKTLLDFRLDKTEQDDGSVPGWFRAVAHLQPPAQRAVVSAGWRQIGHVEVVSEPRFAYEQLWHNSLQMFGWLLAVLGGAWLVARMWLRSLLAPIREMEEVAGDVAKKRFRSVQILPKAIELRQLVAGFNQLVRSIQYLLGEEEARAERFRIESLTDALTRLPNRRWLVQHLEMSRPESAWLGLIQASGIEENNQRYGYAAGDALVRSLGDSLKKVYTGAFVARLGGAEFAVVMDEVEEDWLESRFDALSQEFDGAIARAGLESHLSGGWVQRGMRGKTDWLGAADTMLREAQQGVGKRIAVERPMPEEEQPAVMGAGDVAEALVDALAQGRLGLLAQPAVSRDPSGQRQTLHREIFAVFCDADGHSIEPGRWWGVAARKGMLGKVDAAVLALLAANPRVLENQSLAVNLSCESWTHQGFVAELPDLRRSLAAAKSVCFELREAEAVRLRGEARVFADYARQAGFGVAIDRFGATPGGIAALRELLPDYVKLDASIVSEIVSDAGRFHLESLVMIARTLDIPVLAHSFSETDLLARLTELGVQGVQGYATGKVESLVKAGGVT